MVTDVLGAIREAERTAEERIKAARYLAEERKRTADGEAGILLETALAAALAEAEALRSESDRSGTAEAEALRAEGRRQSAMLGRRLSLAIAEGAGLVLDYVLAGTEKLTT